MPAPTSAPSAAHRLDVTIVGLGLMGCALAGRFLDHGFRVRVWNRTRSKAEPLLARGAIWSETPFAEGGRVVVSLYSSEVVTEVLDRFAPSIPGGTIVVDTTTGDPEQMQTNAATLASRGVHYLEAPISGSSEQTRRGEASVMVGGDPAIFQQCADLWPVLGKQVTHLGPCGQASRMKLVTNLVLGLNRAALAEGLVFAEHLGLDPSRALEMLRSSAAYSTAMDVKGRKMVERDHAVQARLSQHLKDVRLMLALARKTHCPLPMSATHAGLLEKAEERGFGPMDNSAIIEAFHRPSTPAA